MELLKLNGSSLTPEDLIEGWDELIWSERYDSNGDFSLVTKNIDETLAALPPNSMVSLADTNEVCVVESRLVEENDSNEEVLKITGRTFEKVVLENRSTNIPGNPQLTPPDWAMNQFPSVHGVRILNMGYLPYNGTWGIPEDNIPGIGISNSVNGAGEVAVVYHDKYYVEGQATDHVYIYDHLKGVLDIGKLGLRNWRTPSWYAGKTIVTEIYKGTDRSVGVAANPIILGIETGSLAKSAYLNSIQNLKTAAYVTSPVGGVAVNSQYVSGIPSGVARKVLNVTRPDEDVYSAPSIEYINQLLTAYGQAELAKYNRTQFVSGESSETSPYIYNKHYRLGDIVTLQTDYASGRMQVTEYIRTENSEGERGHPTLTFVL